MTSKPALWLGGAVALSLAANLFLGGALAGRFSFGAPTPSPRESMRARFRALPDADKERFRAQMRQFGAGIPAAALALRSAQRHAVEALRATPYDKAAMEQAFADLRAANQAYQSALHPALAEAFATLSPAERAALGAPTQ